MSFFSFRNIFLLSGLIFSGSGFADNHVSIEVRSSSYSYPFHVQFREAPRLNEVILASSKIIYQRGEKSGHQSDLIFWSGAGLFQKKPDANLTYLRDQSLVDLKNFMQTSIERAYFESFSSFVQFIEQSYFQPRLPLIIDLDQNQLSHTANPRIEEAHTLLLPKKPTSVLVLGAISETTRLPYRSTEDVTFYLDQVQLLSHWGLDEIVVIEPSGKINTVPFAYWNAQSHIPMPGSMIYVPYSSVFQSYQTFNTRIPRLLQHRVI